MICYTLSIVCEHPNGARKALQQAAKLRLEAGDSIGHEGKHRFRMTVETIESVSTYDVLDLDL